MADEIEPVREEIVSAVIASHGAATYVVDVKYIRVCLTCGVFVPTYAAAFHTNYHRKRGDV